MMRDAPDLTGKNIDRDDLLLVQIPWGDVTVAVVASAVEQICDIFRRNEREILKRPSRDRRGVARIVPAQGEKTFITRKAVLLVGTFAQCVISDIREPH